MNAFVFRVPLWLCYLLIWQKVDFLKVPGMVNCSFQFTKTLLSIILVALFSLLWKDKTIVWYLFRHLTSQCCHSPVLHLFKYIYGNTRYGSVYIIGSVPLYNIMAVIVLSFLHGTKVWTRRF